MYIYLHQQVNSGRMDRGLPEVLAITNSSAKVDPAVEQHRMEASNSSGAGANSIRHCTLRCIRLVLAVSTISMAGNNEPVSNFTLPLSPECVSSLRETLTQQSLETSLASLDAVTSMSCYRLNWISVDIYIQRREIF